VGFATEQELLQTIQKKEPLFAQGILDDFKEEFGLVSKAYARFQNSQVTNDQGSDDFKQAKAELNRRLDELNHKLNVYLATNYGIDAERKPKEFEKWLLSHQPFHWFAEYYQIIAGKEGFDVIIGNPPYIEYSVVRKVYSISDSYQTFQCNNLHAFVQEKVQIISNKYSRNGLIVPMSSIGSKRMSTLQSTYINSYSSLWLSHYPERPSQLFEGARPMLTIVIGQSQKNVTICNLYSTRLYRWYSDSRNILFDLHSYNKVNNDEQTSYSIPKYGDNLSNLISKKVKGYDNDLKLSFLKSSSNELLYNRSFLYWFKSFTFHPKFISEHKLVSDDHQKSIFTNSPSSKHTICSLFNSSLFYWYTISVSNGREITSEMINDFKFSSNSLNKDIENLLLYLSQRLMEDLNKNSKLKVTFYKNRGEIQYQEFFILYSKSIIDQIDTVLAQHYGFTEEELDFIINYDIKYRMGKALFGEADTEEEDDSEE
jgi:hypothetical protein